MGGGKRFARALCAGVPAASLRHLCSEVGIHRGPQKHELRAFQVGSCSSPCDASYPGFLADPFCDHSPPVLTPTHRKDDERMQSKDRTEQEDSLGRGEDAWDAARILLGPLAFL